MLSLFLSYLEVLAMFAGAGIVLSVFFAAPILFCCGIVFVINLANRGINYLRKKIESRKMRKLEREKERERAIKILYKLMQQSGLDEREFVRELVKFKVQLDSKKEQEEEQKKELERRVETLQELGFADDNILTALEKEGAASAFLNDTGGKDERE